MPGLDADAIRTRLTDAKLYLCTGARRETGDLADFVDRALSGGVDIVQLRDKAGVTLEAAEEIAALRVIAQVCARHGALLAVNDRADIARAVDADVLHLGQDDIPVELARDIVGDIPVIGRSTHSLKQALAADSETGVDYFCVGPCWPTPTKPGRPAPGLPLIRAVSDAAPTRPWFAIGGIDEHRLEELQLAGAHRVVVVRAITEASDPRAAARALRRRL